MDRKSPSPGETPPQVTEKRRELEGKRMARHHRCHGYGPSSCCSGSGHHLDSRTPAQGPRGAFRV